VPYALWRAARESAGQACVIPPGGSDEVGTLGYVEAGLELAAQWQDGVAPRPTSIHLAAGTLGTAAGLALGLALAGESVQVAGARITSRLVTNERALLNLIRGALRLLEPYATAPLPDAGSVARSVTLLHDQVGDGYGRETAAGVAAARRFEAAGILLDATYTAKSAAALLSDPRTYAGDTLFLHTLSAVAPIASAAAVSDHALPPQIAERIQRMTSD
jgi:D-cysteine desulfhydrase